MTPRYAPSTKELMSIMELGAIGELVGGVAVRTCSTARSTIPIP